MNLWSEAAYRQNQLNVFLDKCLSTYIVGFVEASVKSESESMSNTLRRHFFTEELPSRNCVSGLPLKGAEELVSLMSSASSSIFVDFVCAFDFLKSLVMGKKRIGWETKNQPVYFDSTALNSLLCKYTRLKPSQSDVHCWIQLTQTKFNQQGGGVGEVDGGRLVSFVW